MTARISIKGGTLTGHFAHRDPLEIYLAYRVRVGLEQDRPDRGPVEPPQRFNT
ncbi:MAG: hypothetical protein U5M53_01365 [Rhodoferax sp.]|nr:hypothetical protein [Rhodoferax sp.]